MVLRDRSRLVHLLCEGDSIAIDPMAISVVIGDFPAIERSVRALKPFAEMFRQSNPRRASVGWTPQSLGLRNALIALDGAIHGVSHREVAEVIFGPRCVAEDWSGGHGWMKSRVIRAVKKGQQLMEGGYRDLLK